MVCGRIVNRPYNGIVVQTIYSFRKKMKIQEVGPVDNSRNSGKKVPGQVSSYLLKENLIHFTRQADIVGGIVQLCLIDLNAESSGGGDKPEIG